MDKSLLRYLPKVDELLNLKEIVKISEKENRNILVDSLREAIDFYRKSILEGKIEKLPTEKELINKLKGILKKKNTPHLKRVVNGAGIVIHTNLGRSLLCDDAVENVNIVAKHYNNLEYNLEKGARGN